MTGRSFLGLYSAAVVGLAVLVLVFGALGHAARIDEPTDFDNAVHAWVVRERPEWPLATTVLRWATQFGNPPFAIVATVAVAVGLYVCHWKGLWQVRAAEPFVWLAAILGGWLLSVGFKTLFQRERPPAWHRLVIETTYSFPSGHSVFSAVFFSMLGYVLARTISPSRPALRAFAVVSCVLSAVLVAASRVWLGVHYPTDVVGGLLLGLAWTFTVWLGRLGWDHWFRANAGDA